jgi:hypothetical protein
MPYGRDHGTGAGWRTIMDRLARPLDASLFLRLSARFTPYLHLATLPTFDERWRALATVILNEAALYQSGAR